MHHISYYGCCCRFLTIQGLLIRRTFHNDRPLEYSISEVLSTQAFIAEGALGITDLGSSTVSSTCSMAAQAMKSVNVTAAALPPVGVIVRGLRPTCMESASSVRHLSLECWQLICTLCQQRGSHSQALESGSPHPERTVAVP